MNEAAAVARVALAGNPNTGKTTLFNRLTGAQGRVGNYPGVTVELLAGAMALPEQGTVEVVDIPGTASLVARSTDERIAIETLLGLRDGRRPGLVIVCVDATNLVRNLYLALQIQELGLPVIVALTMVDEAPELVDAGTLSAKLGCPVIPLVARTGQGIDELKRAVQRTLGNGAASPMWRWQPGPELDRAMAEVADRLPAAWPRSQALALWALMSSGEDADPADEVAAALDEAVARSALTGVAVDDEAIRARYRWLDEEIQPLLRGTAERHLTRRVDRLLLHPVWGFAVFLLLMFILFQSLFAWADPAISLVEVSFAALGDGLVALLPPGILTDLLVEGVIGGVGSVVVFLPQILLLFFLIGLMEDSGYMARVAYLMDRIMKSMGLHGRAFVPMLSGFACAIPAIMATRTMERRRDRLLTMMVIPLMTCSARLPVYTLLIAALFPASALFGVFPVQGTLMIGMYLFSVLMALAAAWGLSKTVLRASAAPLVLELPPYRIPRLPDVLRMMWMRTRYFLREAGGVILACTIVLWALLSFPRIEQSQAAPADAGVASATAGAEVHAGERLRHSYAGRLGRAIEPVIAPLGFDWKIGIGLIGAFAAREVFVATMGVVYNIGEDVDETSTTLRAHIRNEVKSDGTRLYTPLAGLSLMVFFALACQCMSTLAVVRRETKSWRWPLFLFGYMTVLAWVASFTVYQGGLLLGFE